MELQKGRPKDTAGRLEKEIRTYDLLDKLGVAYERVDHAPGSNDNGDLPGDRQGIAGNNL